MWSDFMHKLEQCHVANVCISSYTGYKHNNIYVDLVLSSGLQIREKIRMEGESIGEE